MDPIHFFVFLFIRNVFGTMKNKRRKKNVTVHFFPEHFSFVFPIQCIRFLRWSSSLRFSKVYFVSGTVDYLLLPYRIIIFFFINDRKECEHNRNRIRTVFIVSCFRIVVRVLAMIRLGLSFFSLLRSMSACVFLLLSSSSLGIMCIEEIGKICVRTTVEWREQKKKQTRYVYDPDSLIRFKTHIEHIEILMLIKCANLQSLLSCL